MSNFKLLSVIKNIIYSFASFALPTAVLQFIVQPYIANYLGAEENGRYLTIMSLNYFIIGITASVLNTVRLLQQGLYEEKKYKGDFNIIFIVYILLITVTMPVGYYIYSQKFIFTDVCLILVISYLYLYHDYIFCEYRITLKYNKILANNILMTVGYLVGMFFFFLVHKWQIIYISAYTFTAVFDLLNTRFWAEPLRKTPLFKTTTKMVAKLTCSNAIGTVPTYCDKFILYPLLGGESVSVYNSASIVGKILNLVSAPLNSVLLSYIVKVKELKVKIKKIHIMCGIVVAVIAYLACVFLGYPLTSYLYPKWAAESQKYIYFTVAASLFTLFSSIVSVIIVRFYDLKIKAIIETVSLVLYCGASLIGLQCFGLYGFCIALAIVPLVKLIICLIFVHKISIIK